MSGPGKPPKQHAETKDAAKPAVAYTPTRADRRMIEALVCPVTQAPLRYDRAAGELISKAAHLAYPVRGGIPIMLESEARKLD